MHTAITIGKAWRQVSHFPSSSEILLGTVLNERTGKYILTCWDPGIGDSRSLAMQDWPITTPAFQSQTNEILFSGRSGIESFSLTTGRIRIFLPFDWEMFEVQKLWIEPNDFAVYYMLAERHEPWSRQVEKMRNGEAVYPTFTHSLHAYRSGGSPRQIFKFASYPMYGDIDWQRNAMFALLGVEQRKLLVRIDLHNGEEATVRHVDAVSPSGVAVSPRHNPVIWGESDLKIKEILANQTETVVSEFGGHPSFSTNGQRVAFTIGDYQVWIVKDTTASAEQVISVPEEAGHHTVEVATWCACGKHFAIGLPLPGHNNQLARALLLVDCERKEIVLSNAKPMQLRNRVWVPASTLKGLASRNAI